MESDTVCTGDSGRISSRGDGNEMKLNDVCEAMLQYYTGDAKRIQHFIKVHSFAKLIGEMENLSSDEQYVLESFLYFLCVLQIYM